jgi:hypothetical protein
MERLNENTCKKRTASPWPPRGWADLCVFLLFFPKHQGPEEASLLISDHVMYHIIYPILFTSRHDRAACDPLGRRKAVCVSHALL